MTATMTPTEILSKLTALIAADPRGKGSDGTWDRTVRHAGLPVIATYIVDGTFALNKGKATTYENDLVTCPDGYEWEATSRAGQKQISRRSYGIALLGIDAGHDLAEAPAPMADKLGTYLATLRQTEELMMTRADLSDALKEIETLTAKVRELETELVDLRAVSASPNAVADAPKGTKVTTPKPDAPAKPAPAKPAPAGK